MTDALEILKLERTDAWFDYLYVTRGKQGAQYEKIESWAWRQLETRLRAIAVREKKIAAA